MAAGRRASFPEDDFFGVGAAFFEEAAFRAGAADFLAATAAGDTPVADQARLDLAGNLRHADAGLPVLSEIARPSAQAH